MNFQCFKKDFGVLKIQTTTLVVANAMLVFFLGFSLYMNFQSDAIVINNLNESCLETAISSDMMNDANHRKLGFFLANTLGNITPKTAEYIKNAVMPFASPQIYHKTEKLITEQLAVLVKENVTISFIPEKAFVEAGITYVTGKGSMNGILGKGTVFVRTYEFVFKVENYTPTFHFVNVYDDIPHDSSWKKKNPHLVGN